MLTQRNLPRVLLVQVLGCFTYRTNMPICFLYSCFFALYCDVSVPDFEELSLFHLFSPHFLLLISRYSTFYLVFSSLPHFSSVVALFKGKHNSQIDFAKFGDFSGNLAHVNFAGFCKDVMISS